MAHGAVAGRSGLHAPGHLATVPGLRLLGDLPLTHALRDQAVRLLVARALPRAFAALDRHDRAFAHPLALFEAMLRGHGLSAYAHDLRRLSALSAAQGLAPLAVLTALITHEGGRVHEFSGYAALAAALLRVLLGLTGPAAARFGAMTK